MRFAAIFAALAVLVAAPASAQEISADNCSVVNQGDDNRTFLVCGDLKIEAAISPEVFEARIATRTEELREEAKFLRQSLATLMQTGQANAEAIAEQAEALKLAEAALAEAAAKQGDLDAAYKEAVLENDRLRGELEALRAQDTGIAAARFDEALVALARGDTNAADTLFSEILALESDRQVIERQARAHYEKGRIADDRIDYRAAKDHFVRAAQLQPEEVEYLFEAQSLANKAGDYRLGERFAEDMLRLAEAEGTDTLAYALAAGSLAVSLNDQARYDDAEPLFEKALEINLKILGELHPNTATSYNNIAMNLRDQGRYSEAEPLYYKSLNIYRTLLPDHHPFTLTSYNNVALNLHAQGRFAEAEPLFAKVLEARKRYLHEEHPETATSYNNVALNLHALGKVSNAELFYTKALGIRRRILGENHPDTAQSYNNLAASLSDQGRFGMSEKLHKQALALYRRVFGENHPETAKSYNNAASNLSAQGRYIEAERLYSKALNIRRYVLGERHPNTAISYNNVAHNLYNQNKIAEAVPMFEKALATMAKAVGPQHPHTQLLAANTVFVLTQLERFEAADAIILRYFGQDSPQRASGLAARAFPLYEAGDFDAAATLWLEAIRIGTTARPQDDTDLAIWRQNLAKLRYKQGDYAAAEALYRQAWIVLSTLPDDQQGRTPANFARLLRDAPPSPERKATLAELQARFGEGVGTSDYQP